MTDQIYRKAFEQAKADMARAAERKQAAQSEVDAAHNEVIQLRRTVTALAALCGENVEDSMGLTEAVRTIMKSRSDFVSLNGIKEQVEAIGVSLSDLKNPDASVMSVLSRLVASNELELGTKKVRTQAGNAAEVKAWKRAPAAAAAADEAQA